MKTINFPMTFLGSSDVKTSAKSGKKYILSKFMTDTNDVAEFYVTEEKFPLLEGVMQFMGCMVQLSPGCIKGNWNLILPGWKFLRQRNKEEWL